MRLAWSASAAVSITTILTLAAPFADIPRQPADARGAPQPLTHQPALARQAVLTLSHFNTANSTHDGRLTLSQAQLDGWTSVVRHFAQIDPTGRGYVTLDEVQTYTVSHRHVRHRG